MVARVIAVVLAIVLSQSLHAADPLTIGDPAPPLTLKAFLKGEPIKELKKGTTYVIEFSGTQCAPCVEAMPILSKLQQKHPKVSFISIYTEKPDVVKEYVEKNKDKMGFAVAADDESKSEKAWMEAAVKGGIPCLFIVNGESKIAWIGHPFEMEKPFEEIVKGTFDIELAKFRMRLEQAKLTLENTDYKQMNHSNEINKKAIALIHKNEIQQAVKLLDQAIQENRDWEFEFYRIKLWALLHSPETTDEANRFIAQLYGKVFARRSDTAPTVPDLNRHCTLFASDLIDANRKQPNRFYIMLAEEFVDKGEKLASQLKVDSENGRRKKTLSDRDVKFCRIGLAEARKEWDKAIQLQKEYIEIVRNDHTGKSYIVDWENYQAKRIKHVEEELARLVKAKESSK